MLQLLHELVAEWLCMPYKFRLKEMDAEMEQHETATQSTPGFTQVRRAVGEVDRTEVLYRKELFESPAVADKRVTKEGSPHFSKRLYDVISKEAYSVGTFPLRPGSHHSLAAPQLELLKQACHIFALDDDVVSEVANMKRALLRFLKVSCLARPPAPACT